MFITIPSVLYALAASIKLAANIGKLLGISFTLQLITVLPTLGKGILPDQPKNSAADNKIRPHALFSIKA
jgi:hypothetical protein